MIKNINAFVAKTNFTKSIEGILVTPEKIVATDSFKLIEIIAPTGATENFVAKLPKRLKTFEKVSTEGTTNTFTKKGVNYTTDTRDLQQDFPSYEQIIPTGEPIVTLNLSPESLKDIAEAFAGSLSVTMAIYDVTKPIVFTNKDKSIRALLMAHNK